MNLNLVFLGSKCVGKTIFIKRNLTGEFKNAYHPTMEPSTQIIPFLTNKGEIKFNVWDMPGNCSEQMLDDVLSENKIHGALLMFDLTDESSFVALDQYGPKIGDIYTRLCGNKCDLESGFSLTIHPERRHLYNEVSAKSNYDFEKPFLEFMRHYLGNDTILVEAPTVTPPSVTIIQR